MAASASNPSQLIEVSERAWEAVTPTIKAKLLWSDPMTKRRAQLTRFEPGAVLPMHKHNGDELLYVIEGEITDEAGTVYAGSVGYRPDGCAHSVTSKNGATVFAIITGGVEPATAAADPKSRIIVLSELQWNSPMPGVSMKAFWEDAATKRRAVLARFDAGAKLPLHKHVGDELVFMIEGSNYDEFNEIRVGNLNYRPNGCTHTVSSKHGAVAIAYVTGGVEMLKH
ncbi:MAG TPA: cupin domain-containing protein [Candidatus Binataceae bacterium]|nr:cupin domain-containing protein [Candidatus Binataceae bacterium]